LRMTSSFTCSQSGRSRALRSRPRRAAIIGEGVWRMRSRRSESRNFCLEVVLRGWPLQPLDLDRIGREIGEAAVGVGHAVEMDVVGHGARNIMVRATNQQGRLVSP